MRTLETQVQAIVKATNTSNMALKNASSTLLISREYKLKPGMKICLIRISNIVFKSRSALQFEGTRCMLIRPRPLLHGPSLIKTISLVVHLYCLKC